MRQDFAPSLRQNYTPPSRETFVAWCLSRAAFLALIGAIGAMLAA